MDAYFSSMRHILLLEGCKHMVLFFIALGLTILLYLVLAASGAGRDQELEDREQEEYLRRFADRRKK